MNIVLMFALGVAGFPAVWADDFDELPVNYRNTKPSDRVAQLLERMKSGQTSLQGDTLLKSLRKLLGELQIPESSQILVFSKTSLQRQHISPRTPRALYFSDDCYVGYCDGSDVLEISTVDPQLGAVFYTAERTSESLDITRQTDNCLRCHASSQTRQVPGHLVRSVYVDRQGLPALSMGTRRIDHSSPLRQRWGGWYVTGTHGKQTHLGNFVLGRPARTEDIDNTAGQNVTSLESFFKTDNYLTPHSDLVALMVLEHQTEGHNRITQASFQCRMAMHQQERLNKELGKPADHMWESTKSRIASASEGLVRYLLFCDEAPLTGQLQGTSSFAAEFSAIGPRDERGRTLRDFDLQSRIFKHPCSYLIYTAAFDALPQPVKQHVWRRIGEVVTEQDQSESFHHLSSADRQAIRAIMQSTIAGLPAPWQKR